MTRLASPTVGEVADGSPGEGDWVSKLTSISPGEGEQRVAGDGQLAWRAQPWVKSPTARLARATG